MNTRVLKKAKLVSVWFRLEVGLPFLLFRFPLNVIGGLFFAFSNYFAELSYLSKNRFWARCKLLLKSCAFNALFLLIAWFVHCDFLYADEGAIRIDVPKVYAALLLSLVIPSVLIFCRTLLCLLDDEKLVKRSNETFNAESVDD